MHHFDAEASEHDESLSLPTPRAGVQCLAAPQDKQAGRPLTQGAPTSIDAESAPGHCHGVHDPSLALLRQS